MAESSNIPGNQITVVLKGILDHSFNVSATKLERADSLLLNMHEVTFMNSSGIRQFINWIRDIEKNFGKLRVILTLVPPTVNRQLSTMTSHLPSQLSIDSVYLPYYCDACDSEDRSRLVTMQDVARAQSLESLVDRVPCPKCSAPMEFDAVMDQYFVLLVDRNQP